MADQLLKRNNSQTTNLQLNYLYNYVNRSSYNMTQFNILH